MDQGSSDFPRPGPAPALCLAILGLTIAAGQPGWRAGAGAACKSIIVLVIPFFLLEFLNGFFGGIIKFCCQQAAQKGLNLFNLIFFLGTTDRRRILGLDVARVFCGNIFHLILQVVLVLGLTPWRSVRTSQLVSIASSLLCIIKTTTEMLTEDQLED